MSTWGLDTSDAALVVTELATNALVHAESPFVVTVVSDGGRLVIEVTDYGPGLPFLVGRATPTTDGMGLAVVERLSTWGVRRHMGGGKTVWAELIPAPGGAAPGASPWPAGSDA